MSENKIIFLSELIESKVRKEKELEYYQNQLEELQRKMFFLKKEVDLTKLIIDIVQEEKVLDMREYVESKYIEKRDNE